MIIRNRTTTLGYAARSAVAADRLLMVARIVGFALLTALAARVQVPMFPVPMTLQTAAVLLSGILLGPVAGAASQALYLSMGLSGLPVFAGAVSGFAYLLGPTGGYLVGFVAGAAVAGLLAGPANRSLARLVLAATSGTVVIFALGTSWLALGLGAYLSPSEALAAGIVPFLPAAAAKLILVVTLVRVLELSRTWIR